jgi:hypothetical protein
MDNAVMMFNRMGSMVPVIDAWFRGTRGGDHAESRWNAKGPCKRCGAKTSALGRRFQVKRSGGVWTWALVLTDGRLFEIDNGYAFLPCRSGCGRVRVASMVDGKFNAGKECNAKCMAACGPSCECKCAGKGHGSSFSL